VISEHTFIQRYTSFWQEALPMGSAVVREINRKLRKGGYWRIRRAGGLSYGPVRRDLASELGLRLLAAQMRDGEVGPEPSPAAIEEATQEAARFVQLQRGPATPPLPPPSRLETTAGERVAASLVAFLAKREEGQPITVLPHFPGCGHLAACRGDLLAGETLYEMKVSDEGFRLVDLRQLIVYGALSFAARQPPIRRFGLLNPHLGVFFRAGADNLVELMAGRGAPDLYADLLDFLSTERASA
jgi:hypothetical protein